MRRNDTKRIGDAGEAEALRLLQERGYTGFNLNEKQPNAWTYDLEISTLRGRVKISVKTARAKRDISLGTPRSLERLADEAFVMILMPTAKKHEIQIHPGGYHLLIVPGQVARDEALAMHRDYWGEELTKAAKNTVRIKDEVNRPGSRSRAGQVFARWNATYRDAWHLLPEPSLQDPKSGSGVAIPDISVSAMPPHGEGELRDTEQGHMPNTGAIRDAPHDDMTITPQDIVEALDYLQTAGVSPDSICRMHHFDKNQGYADLLKYFKDTSTIRSVTNRLFGARLRFVVNEHKKGGHDRFEALILEALRQWPLPT